MKFWGWKKADTIFLLSFLEVLLREAVLGPEPCKLKENKWTKKTQQETKVNGRNSKQKSKAIMTDGSKGDLISTNIKYHGHVPYVLMHLQCCSYYFKEGRERCA